MTAPAGTYHTFFFQYPFWSPIQSNSFLDPLIEVYPYFHCFEGSVCIEHMKQGCYPVIGYVISFIHFIQGFLEDPAEFLVFDVSYNVIFIIFLICFKSRIDPSLLRLDISLNIDPMQINSITIDESGLNGIVLLKLSQWSFTTSSQ